MTDNALVDQLKSTRARFLEAVQDVSDAEAKQRPAGDEWSIIEVLAHMIDVDDYYLGQASQVRDQPGAAFTYFDDAAWKLAHPSPEEFELKVVLQELNASHQRVLAGAAALTSEDLRHLVVHPRGIPYTARDILLRFSPHDDNHRKQIIVLRKALE